MLIAAGVLSLVVWIYLVFARGGFWRIVPTAPAASAQENQVHIAAIIPARNEADVVGRAVCSLLQQTGHNTIHIFLVDDGSTDGTAQAAHSAAIALGQAQNLTVVPGIPLPEGWSGKLWAMHQGVEQARLAAPDFLLFTDADIEHAPDSVSTLVSIAQAGR